MYCMHIWNFETIHIFILLCILSIFGINIYSKMNKVLSYLIK